MTGQNGGAKWQSDEGSDVIKHAAMTRMASLIAVSCRADGNKAGSCLITHLGKMGSSTNFSGNANTGVIPLFEGSAVWVRLRQKRLAVPFPASQSGRLCRRTLDDIDSVRGSEAL
jgi:hypothetical protein